MKAYEEWRYICTILDVGTRWSATHPGCFTSEEISRGVHWIGGWVDPRSGPEAVEKRKGKEKPLGTPATN
jgi:hypothetical protein